MVKAIVFDFGNVISETQDAGCFGRQAALTGRSEEYHRSAFWKYRNDFDRGALDGHAMYRKVLADAGVSGTVAELDSLAEALLDEDMASWAHISAAVTAWALSLKAEGYALGILSNMPRCFLDRYEKKIELFVKADVRIFSCDVGQIKPESAIYRTLIARLGLEPGEIVFFDDLPQNIEGARRERINAFLWTGLDRAKDDLRELIG